MPRAFPIYIEDSDGQRHFRGSPRYEAAFNPEPTDAHLRELVERAEQAAAQALEAKAEVEQQVRKTARGSEGSL